MQSPSLRARRQAERPPYNRCTVCVESIACAGPPPMEMKTESLTRTRRSDLAVLLALALARLLLHCATNWQYGFHRDELGVLDDARYLDWGYVSYPPFTPFIARIALTLFGPSLVGLRLFTALAQSIAMIFAGLMTRELGGRRWAQPCSWCAPQDAVSRCSSRRAPSSDPRSGCRVQMSSSRFFRPD